MNTVFPGLSYLLRRADAVAEDDETSDSARTSTSFVFISNLSSGHSAFLESAGCHQNVVVEEIPERSRYPTSGPSRYVSSDSRPRRFQKADICVGGFRTR